MFFREEGGWYVETDRTADSTCIYHLLSGEDFSAWHRYKNKRFFFDYHVIFIFSGTDYCRSSDFNRWVKKTKLYFDY